jgi:hypothetical protein
MTMPSLLASRRRSRHSTARGRRWSEAVAPVLLGFALAAAVLGSTAFGQLTLATGRLELSLGPAPEGYAVRIATRACEGGCGPALSWKLPLAEAAEPTMGRLSRV